MTDVPTKPGSRAYCGTGPPDRGRNRLLRGRAPGPVPGLCRRAGDRRLAADGHALAALLVARQLGRARHLARRAGRQRHHRRAAHRRPRHLHRQHARGAGRRLAPAPGALQRRARAPARRPRPARPRRRAGPGGQRHDRRAVPVRRAGVHPWSASCLWRSRRWGTRWASSWPARCCSRGHAAAASGGPARASAEAGAALPRPRRRRRPRLHRPGGRRSERPPPASRRLPLRDLARPSASASGRRRPRSCSSRCSTMAGGRGRARPLHGRLDTRSPGAPAAVHGGDGGHRAAPRRRHRRAATAECRRAADFLVAAGARREPDAGDGGAAHPGRHPRDLGWDMGAIWIPDPRERAAALPRCQRRRARGGAVPFVEATRDWTFSPGVGCRPGVAERQPLWISDVIIDPDFPRAPLAMAQGLHSAFSFPIPAGRQGAGRHRVLQPRDPAARRGPAADVRHRRRADRAVHGPPARRRGARRAARPARAGPAGQGRVPRHARPRAAQPAGARCATRAEILAAPRRRGCRHRAHPAIIERQVRAHGAAGGRPARRLAHHPRQGGAAPRAGGARRRRRARRRSGAPLVEERGHELAVDAARGAGAWSTAIRCASRRSWPTCSTTRPNTPKPGGHIAIRVAHEGGDASSACATPASASRRRCSAASSTCSSRASARATRRGRAGHRADAGRAAWWSCTAGRVEAHSDGPARAASSSCGCPLARGGARRARPPRRPAAGRARTPRGGCWSWTTTWTPRRAWPSSCASRARRGGRARRRGGARAAAEARVRCRRSSTSGCPAAWTATRWRGGCASRACAERRCSWRSPATARTRTAGAPRRPGSTTTS